MNRATLIREQAIRPRNDFWLRVVIEPFDAPITTRVLNVSGELLIGRGPHAGLPLDDALISRRHALVRATESGLEIEDVSTNGTLVDGALLQRAHPERTAAECILQLGCVRVRLRRLG